MIKLLPHQVPHTNQLLSILKSHGAAIDASDCGTGKTWCAAKIAETLKVSPLVLCPKVSIDVWHEALAVAGIHDAQVINYESARMPKAGLVHFVEKSRMYKGKAKISKIAQWSNPRELVIFDEAHSVGGGTKSLQGSMACELRHWPVKKLLLSATMADNPIRMQSAAYLLGFIHNSSQYYQWVQQYGVSRNPLANNALTLSLNKERRKRGMMRLHKDIFPRFGARMRWNEIPGYPGISKTAQKWDIPSAARAVERVKKEMRLEPAVQVAGALHRVSELETAKEMVGVAKDLVSQGCAVLLFVSYRDTMAYLKEHIPDAGYVEGDQNTDERRRFIEMFQDGRINVMILNYKAASFSLNLHDLIGVPRVSLHFPPFSALELEQAFGRTHRTGSVSDPQNILCFPANTPAEKTYENVREKLTRLRDLNDGDLQW